MIDDDINNLTRSMKTINLKEQCVITFEESLKFSESFKFITIPKSLDEFSYDNWNRVKLVLHSTFPSAEQRNRFWSILVPPKLSVYMQPREQFNSKGKRYSIDELLISSEPVKCINCRVKNKTFIKQVHLNNIEEIVALYTARSSYCNLCNSVLFYATRNI